MASKRNSSTTGISINVVKFIHLMKEYPIPPGRQSKVEVDETWKLLEREMGVPKNILMTKWRNLVIAYRRELRLELMAGHGYESRWPYFKAMDFMRHDILSKMKTNQSRPSVETTGSYSAVDSKQQNTAEQCSSAFQSEPMGETASVDHEPYHEMNEYILHGNDFPFTDVPSAFSRVECALSGHVYDFLMSRIHPFVVAMPIDTQTEVLAQMQQLVFEKYQRQR